LKNNNIRALAAHVLEQVIDNGQSLSQTLPKALDSLDKPQQRARLQEICYGSLRYLRQLQFYANKLIDKPLKKRHRSVELLIYAGLYQLQFMRLAEHAVVAETVEAVNELNASSLKGLVNGVLRSFQRQREQLNVQLRAFPQIELSYPNWLYEKVEQAYSEKAKQILSAGNQYPPMWLRVNQQKTSLDNYLLELQRVSIAATVHQEALNALLLDKPTDVNKLPYFAEGYASVQDAAAQLSVSYLQPQKGERILDCCCAPGGKTCHILESQPGLKELVAIDQDPVRLERVSENLNRLDLTAKVIAADASEPNSWWDGEPFDRILLDAPCSATGVIRRHPDIKWLRKKSDIPQLTQLQASILESIWSLLKPGGRLVYATCSILPEENHLQISDFLTKHSDAQLIPISDSQLPGRQILPGESGMDGFYYAVLVKST
jgi:16S rRNA (cytosine967-C5)-methyltransferase